MQTIYNTLTQEKQVLQPITPGKVLIYVCGITVYDYCHIGHARMLVVFDMVTRYLRARGYTVTYVRNITDIDDKIIRRAHDNDEPWEKLTNRFISAMNEDLAALGVLPPDIEPRATAHIEQIIAMIEKLITQQYAYIAANGDVYYAVKQFPDYGQLSHQSLADLRVGARVEVETSKRDPLDFVLWKMAKPGEPSWPSPWGNGRPGWHIECSAMSTHCLGANFDIHGGGFDLIFPHHQNEIAQSEGATGKKFVNIWMHNGFVQIDAEKMSKSLDNFFTVREVLKLYHPEVLRYFILVSHYRSPLNFSQEALVHARSALNRLYTALRGLPVADNTILDPGNAYVQAFFAAMDDDFNTPQAFAVLFDIAHEINRWRATEQIDRAIELASLLKSLASILGFLQLSPEQYLQAGIAGNDLTDEQINALIAERAKARSQKDWAKSDRIRAQLKEHGIIIEDSTDETLWRRQ